jgi:antitoxin VapB
MALSIRNPKTERLARQLAGETGETITEAITKALEDRLLRVSGRKAKRDLVAEIMEVVRRCSALPDADTRTVDEILGYDEQGGFPPW